MRFSSIKLQHVGRFGEEGVALEGLSPGLNLLCEPNEFGKSTIFEALSQALFVKDNANSAVSNALRPQGSDADPYIEVAFDTGGEAYRLAKRFAKGRKDSLTRLETGVSTWLADEAQQKLWQLVGAEASGKGAPGLLWLKQGSSLDGALGSKADFLSKDDSRTVSQLLVGEVEDASGTGAASRVEELGRKELGELEQPKKQEPRKELKAAIERVADLTAKRDQLAARLRESEELRSKLTELRATLRSLDDPEDRKADEADLAEAKEQAQEGQKLKAELGHTEELLRRDQAEKARLEEEIEQFDAEQKAAKNLRSTQSMAAGQVQKLTEDIGTTETELAAQEERRTTADKKVQQTNTGLQEWATFVSLAETRRGAAERSERLAKAQFVEKDLSALPPRAAAFDLPALRKAAERLARVEAKLEAEAPRLEVISGEGVNLDGMALNQGELRTVTGEGRIEAGGAVMRLHVSQKAALRQEYAEAGNALSTLLDTAECKSLAEAEAKAEQQRTAEQKRQALEASLTALAPEGLQALAARVEADRAALSQAPAQPDTSKEELERGHADALDEAADAAGRIRALAEKLDGLKERRRDAQVEATTAMQALRSLEARLGPEEDRPARQAKLQEKLDALGEKIAGGFYRKTEIDKALRRVREAETRLARLTEAAAARAGRRESLLQNIASTETLLRERQAEGIEEQLGTAAGELELATEKRDALERRRGGLKLLLGLLGEEAEERRRQVTGPVMRELLPMTERLFGESQLRFDDEWNPESLERPGGSMRVAQLSAGTREQLGILSRLAFAKLMAARGEPVPVILDDALTYSDDRRAGVFFDILHEVAQETQIIVLSCHERLFRDFSGHRIEPVPFLTER
ncbi:AAA family ATPase [Parvularcula maris]|uniref:AAA family ATPase n=1 Tax=Parvularcula maris TaxID=2965077 RepID=A0A9X2LBG2_9PROT|nr:AAA family ATPase [Parvularcula maris]MCQ8185467.1 AAA family ATPase [Parvularcula maris]